MTFDIVLVIFLALAAGAVAKGATGMGLPLVALPALAAFLPVQQAISILMVPILVTNAAQVWRFRVAAGDERMAFLRPMAVGGVAGVIFGTWLLTTVPERWLEIGLGTLLLGYLALRLSRPAIRLAAEDARRWGAPTGAAAGVLQGATGISAPIGVTFIHAMRLERDPHVFAVSVMFLGFALVQFPALIVAGVMQPVFVLQGALSLLPIALFMPVGQWLAGRLSATAFDRLILIFLGLMGVKLLLGL